ncbi:DNA polymerase III subunit beta, partial [Francisellaceae bacterium]|nr:DNA polymerase III subunit beta [Francisellaceae bacterium]
ETEVLAEVLLEEDSKPGKATIPARKLIEIIRNLPLGSAIKINQESENKVVVSSNKSRFALSSLDANNFPQMDHDLKNSGFTISQSSLLKAIKKVQFAMAHNDVRYFLNGTLWEIEGNIFRTVATDGHRMAMFELGIDNPGMGNLQIIVPRKAIVELQKLISNSDDVVSIHVGSNHFMVRLPNYTFTSKLIDGRYPDYNRVVPKENHKRLVADLVEFKQALTRTAILSNEKYRGVRLNLDKGVLHLAANNPEQEEASDEIEVDYNEDAMEVGFNVGYLLDVVGAIETDEIDLFFSTANMSLLIKEHDLDDSCYVIMPIRL